MNYQDAFDAFVSAVNAHDGDEMPSPGHGVPAGAMDPGGRADSDAGGGAVDGEDAPLFFGSVDEFVREKIVPAYRRKVGPRGSRRWSARWWTNAEAISRLEAMWRAWEQLRQDPATGMSVWWRDHADYHMTHLFDPEGPFASSQDENKAGEPLPYEPPPPGLFVDARERNTA